VKRQGVRADIRKLWWFVALYLGFYALVALTSAYTLFFKTNIELGTLHSDDMQELVGFAHRSTAVYLGVGGVCLALWRLAAHHPAYNMQYLRWLQTTPWEMGRPLPGGSPLPGITELILLTAAGAFAFVWLPFPLAVWAMAAYPLAYGFGSLTPLVYSGGDKRATHLVSLLLLATVPVVFHQHAWVIAGFALVAFVVAWHGVRHRLTDLPHAYPAAETNLNISGSRRMSSVEPGVVKPPTSWWDATAMSLFLACWVWAINSAVSPRDLPFGLILLGLLVFPLIRVVAYAGNRAPPISLRDRFWLQRLIVPSYDIIFVVPLLSIFAGAGLVAVGVWGGVPAPLITGGATFAVFMILFKCGPPRQRWQLTSDHRVVLPSGR